MRAMCWCGGWSIGRKGVWNGWWDRRTVFGFKRHREVGNMGKSWEAKGKGES
jgi:hypothetical protein